MQTLETTAGRATPGVPTVPRSMKRVAQVMRSGVSAMEASLDVAKAAAAFPNREHREIVLALAPRSYMVVALRARDADARHHDLRSHRIGPAATDRST